MSLLGLLGRGFGLTSGGAAPATPTLTVADNGDGTGAVATIASATAGTTNRVYTASQSGGTWTLSGTRSGNGTVALTLAVGGYFAVVTSALGGVYSLSSVTTFSVTDSTTAKGIVQQICEALVAKLAAADLAGEFAETLGASRAYTTDLDLSVPVDSLSVLVIPTMTRRYRTSNGTYRRDAVIEILVRRHMSADASEDDTGTDARLYLAEQIDDYLAHPDEQDLTLSGGLTAYYVEPTDARAESDVRQDAGVLWLREHLLELRQATAAVRVTYHIDTNYS